MCVFSCFLALLEKNVNLTRAVAPVEYSRSYLGV